MPRCVVLVCDSAGVGALPDARSYGDAPGADTIGNTAARVGGLALPHFERLGLGNLTAIAGVAPAARPEAFVARLSERSKGKDTITGHWEMAGILTEVPFPTYPQGFPADIVELFTEICGKPPLGNLPASGTEIIDRLGPEHMVTGRPILYTSADSVFQVAAHEEVVPLAVLYDWCEKARAVLTPPHNVNRVIARPFIGTPGAFTRTPNRHDYALDPPENLLDRLAAARVDVHAVGKIADIYSGRGISSSVRVVDNDDTMLKTFALLERVEHGFIFVNLNDFDTKYGHRRDVRGYAAALERLDTYVPGLISRLRPDDCAVFTADHGCDPTAPGTDHTREFVPFIELGAARRGDGGTISGLETVGHRVADILLGASKAG
jgi:phosphopentomutase